MEELIKQLITRDKIAELCRLVETIKLERMSMVSDENMPQSVVEYNENLMNLDEEILELLIKIKMELKKG